MLVLPVPYLHYLNLGPQTVNDRTKFTKILKEITKTMCLKLRVSKSSAEFVYMSTQVCTPDWVTAESFVNGMLSGSYSVLSIRQATVNKQDLFYKFWLFHSLPSKSQDNHISITQRQAQTCEHMTHLVVNTVNKRRENSNLSNGSSWDWWKIGYCLAAL